MTARSIKDKKSLERKIKTYFANCDAGENVSRLNKRGDLVDFWRPIPYTVEDLCLHLGMTRETLSQYGKSGEYSDIISSAKTKILSSWIKGAMTGDVCARTVALCLAANAKTYNVKQQVEQQTTVTIEQELRRVRAERRQIVEDIPEAETVEIPTGDE